MPDPTPDAAPLTPEQRAWHLLVDLRAELAATEEDLAAKLKDAERAAAERMRERCRATAKNWEGEGDVAAGIAAAIRALPLP